MGNSVLQPTNLVSRGIEEREKRDGWVILRIDLDAQYVWMYLCLLVMNKNGNENA